VCLVGSLAMTSQPTEMNAICEAVKQGNRTLVIDLLDKDPALVQGAQGREPLLWAAHKRDRAMVSLLLSKGAEVDVVVKDWLDEVNRSPVEDRDRT
jgi:ankyrin repeat protein